MTKNEIIKKIDKCEEKLKSYAMAYEVLQRLKKNGEIAYEVWEELNKCNIDNFNKAFNSYKLLVDLLKEAE